MRKIITLAGLLCALGVAGAGFVYFGVYDVAATEPHAGPTYYFLHYAMRRSVLARVKDVRAPPLQDAARLDNGFRLYRQHCLECHGAPGVAPNALGFGVRPEPVNLVEAAHDWSAEEIYWVVKHGIKMTAMPGWEYRLSDAELWDLVAFVKQLPTVSPQEYKERDAALPRQPISAAITGPVAADRVTSTNKVMATARLGDAEAGRHAIYQYLCTTCHQIPGIVGANRNVGPPLERIATRKYIAGVLLNNPDNMVRWLRHPQVVDPLSAMPELNISERDARDIAAYLYESGKK